MTGLLVSFCLSLGSLSLSADQKHVPRFIDYPVGHIYRGKTHALLAKYKDAIPKTGVLDAPKQKADFAGHYIVIQGSCGTGCSTLSAMDARTGEIYDFGHTLIEDWPSDTPKVHYQLTSNLVILHATLDEKPATNGTYYYVFKGNHFVRLWYIHTKPHHE
jgi:hypothetical protein